MADDPTCAPLYPYPGGLLDTSNLSWCKAGYFKRTLGTGGPSIAEALASPPSAMTAGVTESLKELDVPTSDGEVLPYGL